MSQQHLANRYSTGDVFLLQSRQAVWTEAAVDGASLLGVRFLHVCKDLFFFYMHSYVYNIAFVGF